MITKEEKNDYRINENGFVEGKIIDGCFKRPYKANYKQTYYGKMVDGYNNVSGEYKWEYFRRLERDGKIKWS